MAKPAFIYAFDNMGPDRFAELCGELLGSRYKSFGFLVLGGIGPDGGIDAELDTNLAIWQPESEEALLNNVIQPGKSVIFQFKHIVVARAGSQSSARKQLLSMYRCKKNYTCELHRDLILAKKPTDYVLVTNVEANSLFRAQLIKQCKAENPGIDHYQVISLDKLENWVIEDLRLRHLYFPTIFGPPSYDLRIHLGEGFMTPNYGGFDVGVGQSTELLQVSVLNVGTVPSYIGSITSISFRIIVDGELKPVVFLNLGNDTLKLINPEPGAPLEPGRKHTYNFPFEILAQLRTKGKDVFPVEVVVTDEIGNTYSAPISEKLREKILAT